MKRWLDRLDSLGAVRFTVTLYLVRWAVLLPVILVVMLVDSDPGPANEVLFEALNATEPGYLFFQLVLLGPAIETLVECTLPYIIMRSLMDPERSPPRRVRTRVGVPRRRRRTGATSSWDRPWHFVACSATVMVLLHPLEWQVILPTAITGCFLGYTYGHFAREGFGPALGATTSFHAGINVVGFTLIVLL